MVDGLVIGPRRALEVLVAKPWRITRVGEPQNKWVVPVWINGPCDFLLLAVWAMEDKKSSVRSYIGQLHEALAKHPEWLAANELKIIAGDFNSNKTWDEGAGSGDHSALVALFEKHSVVSAYHVFFLNIKVRSLGSLTIIPAGNNVATTWIMYSSRNIGVRK